MKYVILVYFLAFFLQNGYSQQMTRADSLSRMNALAFIDNCLEKEVKGKDYLFLSIADKWHIIIINEKDFYKEYFALENDTLLCDTINVSDTILSKAFNKDLYHKSFINLNSDFYQLDYILSNGNPTYFFFMDKNKVMLGESKLTTIIKPIPFDDSIYYYLLSRLLNFVASNENK